MEQRNRKRKHYGFYQNQKKDSINYELKTIDLNRFGVTYSFIREPDKVGSIWGEGVWDEFDWL